MQIVKLKHGFPPNNRASLTGYQNDSSKYFHMRFSVMNGQCFQLQETLYAIYIGLDIVTESHVFSNMVFSTFEFEKLRDRKRICADQFYSSTPADDKTIN